MPDSLSHSFPSTSPHKRPAVRKPGRPSRAQLAGRTTWIRRLLTAGRIDEAVTFAASVNLLHCLPPDVVSAHSRRLAEGGAGVAVGDGDNNNYNSTQTDQILQSNESLTIGVDAFMEVSQLVATQAEVEEGEEVLARSSASNVPPLHGHSPAGELEGKQCFGQAGIMDNSEKTQSNNSSQWVEEGEGLVGKLCRNKQYNELRLAGEKGELWTKVGNWQWRSGLVRGERVWVKRVWVSADDTDSEYVVLRRMDVNEGKEEGQDDEMPEEAPVAVIKDVIEPIEEVVGEAAPEPDRSAVLPQFLKQEPVYPRKPESADEYIARIRADTVKWANGMGA
jgi:hypothetical protein